MCYYTRELTKDNRKVRKVTKETFPEVKQDVNMQNEKLHKYKKN